MGCKLNCAEPSWLMGGEAARALRLAAAAGFPGFARRLVLGERAPEPPAAVSWRPTEDDRGEWLARVERGRGGAPSRPAAKRLTCPTCRTCPTAPPAARAVGAERRPANPHAPGGIAGRGGRSGRRLQVTSKSPVGEPTCGPPAGLGIPGERAIPAVPLGQVGPAAHGRWAHRLEACATAYLHGWHRHLACVLSFPQ